MTRRALFKFLASLAIAAAPLGALAGALQPFSGSAFQAAQRAGKPVLLEVHADWCPTCRAQAPILDRLAGEARYAGIERFRIDFDSQKSVAKKLGARYQSTLILFKGKGEVGRSVGITAESDLRALLDKAL